MDYLRREVFVTDESGMEKRKVVYRLDPNTVSAVKMEFELYLVSRGGKHIAGVLTSCGFRSATNRFYIYLLMTGKVTLLNTRITAYSTRPNGLKANMATPFSLVEKVRMSRST